MRRVFSSTPLPSRDTTVWELPPSLGHYVTDVLRLGPGDSLALFDADGESCRAEIQRSEKGVVEVSFEEWDLAPQREQKPYPISLVVCLTKGRKMDWVLQKATELGVSEIRLALSERTIVRPGEDRIDRRITRWNRICGEAARQCGRMDVPAVFPPQPVAEVVASLPEWASDLKILLWEDAVGRSIKQAFAEEEDAQGCCIIVGPEGGFSGEEADGLRAAGCLPVTLGPRILRAETAPVAALSIVQLLRGDMG